MDLFSLVAKLTLDADEYEQALRQAESEGQSFDGNVEGTIDANDEYTPVVDEAEDTADNFDGDASGTLTGTDDYTDEEKAAQTSADEFDGDVEGDIDGEDDYSAEVDIAQASADSFDGDVDGTLSGKDDYTDDKNTAQSAANAFDGDVDGTLSGKDEYSDDEGTAQASANAFDGDVDGTVTGTDAYSDDVEAAQDSANDFDGDRGGTISGTDDYSEIESAAQESADDFDGDVEGNIDGEDDYSAEVDTAQASADSFDGDVEGTITVDDEDFNNDMASASSSLSSFESTFSGMTERLAGMLTAAGIVAAIQAISQAFQEAVNSAATYADTVDKGSRALSMSTDAYQVWQHALSQSGADIGDVRRGWLNLTDAIDMATHHTDEWAEDTGEVKKALETLGVNPKNFENTEALFSSVIDVLSTMEAGSQRDSLVTAIFGRNGTQLNALLDSGKKGIQELKDEAYELGLVMSEEDIAKGVSYGDAVANMNAAVEALKQNIVSGLFPLLTDAANMITRIVAFFNGRTNDGGVIEWMSDIDEKTSQAFNQATSDEAKALSLIETLKSMTDETGKCKGNLELWKGIAEELISLCPNLANSFDLPNGKIKDQTKSLEENAKAWFANARAQAVVTALSEKQAALAKQASEIVDKQLEANVAMSEAEGKRALAIKQINKQLENIGMGEVEGYRPEDVAQMSLEQLADLQKRMLSDVFRTGLDVSLKKEIDATLEAGTEALAQYNELTAQIAAMEEALATATEQYQQYAAAADTYLKTIQEGINSIPDTKTVTITVNDPAGIFDGSHAKGLNYVPYDGYVAELHRGEMILNQAQSREYRGGNRGGIDADAIAGIVANAITNALSGMAINMDGSQVGNVVTRQVSQNLASQMRSRRYT